MTKSRPFHLTLESPAAGATAETRSLLVHAAKGGDVRAFATLVDTYYARCLRFALHMLGNRDDAEEAVQDAFIRVYRALPGYEEREAFEPWLFRILANRCPYRQYGTPNRYTRPTIPMIGLTRH